MKVSLKKNLLQARQERIRRDEERMMEDDEGRWAWDSQEMAGYGSDWFGRFPRPPMGGPCMRLPFMPPHMMPVIIRVNPFMPTVAFNICCPRDCVSRHNGGTPGAPLLNPSETIVLSERGPHYAERCSLSDSKC